jgi:anaerobic ribonucleoside-triphosphate reductase activating protein
VTGTVAEGPLTRTAVWVAGCSIQCPGCFNPHLFSPGSGTPLDPSVVVQQARESHSEGITLLGGEPFDQADALAVLARLAKSSGLGVMTFSGYTLGALLSQVRGGRQDVAALLQATDLLVDGPFMSAKLDMRRPWVGSTNQQFRFLTPRYAGLAADLAETPDRLEIRVDRAGGVQINGWAPQLTLDALITALDLTFP